MEGLGVNVGAEEMPTISVIMLTYNREKLVSRAIDSILVQTLADFEFIIIDNGSTDRSGIIADEYAEKDDRIRVIHRERGNIGSGRNAGLDASKGEYIAFIDDDDWCEPDFLEFVYKLSGEYDADIAICGANDKNYEEKCVYTNIEAMIVLFWRKRFNAQLPTKLMRRKLFDGVRFSEIAKYDDIELMPKMFASANRIAYHGLSKYTFYRHDSNNSAWTSDHNLLNAPTLDEYLRVYRERTKMLCEKFPANSETWLYFEWSFWISMVEKVARLEIKDCYAAVSGLKLKLKKHRGEFLYNPNTQGFEKEWVERYILREAST